MSESILKKNILLICPSISWSTRERAVVRDIILLKREGAIPIIYCLRESHLDLKAQELNVERIYHRGVFSHPWLDWFKFSNLGQVIKKYEVDVVHLYIPSLAMPIGFFMGKFRQIPLILSYFEKEHRILTKYFSGPTIHRLDAILTPSEDLFLALETKLNLPKRKMHCLGLGIHPSKEQLKSYKEEFLHGLALPKDQFLIGVYIESDEQSLERYMTIFHFAYWLMQDNIKVMIILYSDRNWDNHYLFSEIKNYLKDNGLDSQFYFYRDQKLSHLQSVCDLWLGVEHDEYVQDVILQAILGGTKVLVPRYEVYQNILRDQANAGECYQGEDARELRLKISKMMQNIDNNMQHKIPDKAYDHSWETYRLQFLDIYLSVLKRRIHYSTEHKLNEI
jgi:hypothetical protein